MHLSALLIIREKFRSILTAMIPLLLFCAIGCQSGENLLQDDRVDWNRYYSNDETNIIMQRYQLR